MLLGTYFRRPNAPIELGDKKYFFKPRNPNDPESEHVCEVTDKGHLQRLLAIAEGYYIADDQPPTAPAARPQAAPVATLDTSTGQVSGDASVAGNAGAAATAGDGADQTGGGREEETDTSEAARNLLDLHWQKLRAEVAKGGIPKAVLREAQALETARGEDARSTVLKALEQAIGAA